LQNINDSIRTILLTNQGERCLEPQLVLNFIIYCESSPTHKILADFLVGFVFAKLGV
jgi:hypothetical protein